MEISAGGRETFPFTNVYRTVFLSLPCKPKNEISYDSEESEDDKVVHQGESKIEEGVGRKERYWRIDGLKEGVGEDNRGKLVYACTWMLFKVIHRLCEK